MIEYLIPKKISIFFIFIKEFCMSAIIEFTKEYGFPSQFHLYYRENNLRFSGVFETGDFLIVFTAILC